MMENWLAFGGGILGGIAFAAFWYIVARWRLRGGRSLM